jgi:prefoldin alpha subunit
LMTQASPDEEALKQFIMEIRYLEGTAETLQTRLNMIEASLADLRAAHSTLEGIRVQKVNDQVLIPIGGNTYVKAKLEDPANVITGIGAEVAMDKSVEETAERMNQQLSELEKIRTSIQQQLSQVVTRLEEDRVRLNEMTGR